MGAGFLSEVRCGVGKELSAFHLMYKNGQKLHGYRDEIAPENALLHEKKTVIPACFQLKYCEKTANPF